MPVKTRTIFTDQERIELKSIIIEALQEYQQTLWQWANCTQNAGDPYAGHPK
jgi:hypothetical protein